MRKKVADAEAKVEAFRAKSNLLVGPNNTTLSAQQLGDLNAQLATARAQKSDAEAKAKLIRDMLKSGASRSNSSDILNSELIRRLSEQRVTLRAQLAEQSSSLLDNHPRIKELKAQIADLDSQIRNEAETIARSLENDSKLADARVAAQLATFDQLKSQAATTNEDDVQLRALERDAKSQRDLLESYLAKYREASARDTLGSAPPDARIISRAMVSNVPAYPKKLPTVLIATLATLVLTSGLVLTRELLAAPPITGRLGAVGAGGGADGRAKAGPAGRGGREGRGGFGGLFGGGRSATSGTAAAAARAAEPAPMSDSLAARLASLAKKQQPVGVPVSAIETFAHQLHQEGFESSQFAFLAAAAHLDTGRIAIKFARALADEKAKVVLVGLGGPGAGDAAIRQISNEPDAAGLAELAAGTATSGAIITKDASSGLNLIVSSRAGRTGAEQRALIAAPGMSQYFAALAEAYDHVIVDAGVLDGAELAAIAGIAAHAILIVETLAGAATAKAREHLLDCGFDDVTILVAGRSEPAASAIPDVASPVAA